MHETAIFQERRRKQRYRIRLELRWRLVSGRKVADQGTGQTVDLSSCGLHFESSRSFESGEQLEIALEWPVMLHNITALQFVVTGKTVRSDGKLTAIELSHYEFRTRAVFASFRLPAPPLCGVERIGRVGLRSRSAGPPKWDAVDPQRIASGSKSPMIDSSGAIPCNSRFFDWHCGTGRRTAGFRQRAARRQTLYRPHGVESRPLRHRRDSQPGFAGGGCHATGRSGLCDDQPLPGIGFAPDVARPLHTSEDSGIRRQAGVVCRRERLCAAVRSLAVARAFAGSPRHCEETSPGFVSRSQALSKAK